jgi:hypothetical protein
MKSFLLLLASTLVLTSCATTYQANGLTGGFSETQLDEDLFTVRFAGNGYTSSERASDFALLRCADLAIQNNFPYFKIIDSQSNMKTSYIVTTDTNFNASSYGNSLYGSSNQTTNVKAVEKPRINLTVRLLRDKVDGSYNAAFIQKSIRAKYKMVQD